ncbi:MAG TPA: aminotransferase class IV, partial [Bacteroidales bacterium]|nr:aminotransferase class IV [Bacteroidales bacterium]
MSECYSKVFIENGKLKDHSLFNPGKVFEGEVIYEVIRIRSGIPMFLDDHFARLENSALTIGKKLLLDYDSLKYHIIRLIAGSNISDGNVKINLKYNGEDTAYILYYVDAKYPDRDMYTMGVKGILYYAERRNPTVKIFNHKLRSAIYSRLLEANAYEALLVNRKGCITEGSRSNLFFIKDDLIITAPDDCV